MSAAELTAVPAAQTIHPYVLPLSTHRPLHSLHTPYPSLHLPAMSGQSLAQLLSQETSSTASSAALSQNSTLGRLQDGLANPTLPTLGTLRDEPATPALPALRRLQGGWGLCAPSLELMLCHPDRAYVLTALELGVGAGECFWLLQCFPCPVSLCERALHE